jgi:hypothetical protein
VLDGSLTLRIVGLVHGEQLMADQVISWCEGGRDGGGPVEGVEDCVAGPDAGVLGAGDEAFFVDFDWGIVLA